MSDTTTSPQTGTPGKIVSAGQPQAGTIPIPGITAPIDDQTTGGELTDEQKAAAAAAANKLPELTDDQLKELLKGKGIELDDTGFDGLAQKLKPASASAPEPTAEEKAATEAAFEKRMLDHYISHGGTAESFVAFKQIASTDLTLLSESELKREMKADGFDDEEIAEMIKERYYQIKLDELEEDVAETTEEFEKRKAKLEKKIAYGSKAFGAKGAEIKKQAESALSALREAVNTEDLLVANEAKLSSKVDEIAAKLPRKLTFELGLVNDQQIAPIEYKVDQKDIDDVIATLKDPAKRNKLLYNEDKGLNLSEIAQLLLRNKILESSLKAGYLEASDRQVAEFNKRFPGRIARDIGVGGNNGSANTGRPGVVVSAGKPEPAGRK